MSILSKAARKAGQKARKLFKKKYSVQEGAGLDPEGGGSVAAARAVGTKGEKVTRGKLSMANFERDQRKYSNFDAKKLLKLYKEDRPAYNRAIKRLEEAESRRVRKAAIGRRDASQKRKADATPDKLTPEQEIAKLRDLNTRARLANDARQIKAVEKLIDKFTTAGTISSQRGKVLLSDIKSRMAIKQNKLAKAMEKEDLELGKAEGESQIGRRKKTQSPREFKSRAEERAKGGFIYGGTAGGKKHNYAAGGSVVDNLKRRS